MYLAITPLLYHENMGNTKNGHSSRL